MVRPMPSDAGCVCVWGGAWGALWWEGLTKSLFFVFFKAYAAVHMFKRKHESTDFACKGYLK